MGKEKKEIGMEKLIELLNEYNEAEILDEETLEVNGKYHDIEYLYTKKFGFIKWLVENDKIETNNLSLKAFKNIFSGGGFVEVSDLEVLLMLLSISSSPIDDLISYLK